MKGTFKLQTIQVRTGNKSLVVLRIPVNREKLQGLISFFGTRYSWEKTNNFNPKITAKQLVINILRTFRP